MGRARGQKTIASFIPGYMPKMKDAMQTAQDEILLRPGVSYFAL